MKGGELVLDWIFTKVTYFQLVSLLLFTLCCDDSRVLQMIQMAINIYHDDFHWVEFAIEAEVRRVTSEKAIL